MDINKFKINNQRHLNEVFKKLESLIYEPEMYRKISGQLIFSSIAAYVFSTEAKIYWDSFLLQILKIKYLQSYVSIKTIHDLLKPLLENYLIGNVVDLEEFNLKIEELQKYKTNKNYHYFIVSGITSKSIYTFSNIRIGLFEERCPKVGVSFSQKIESNNQEIIESKKAKGTYLQNDYFYDEILKEIDSYRDKTVLEIEHYGDQYISEEKSIKEAEHFINELIFLRSLCSNFKFQIELKTDITKKNLRPIRVNYDTKSLGTPSEEVIFTSVLDFSDKNDPQHNIAIPCKDLALPLISPSFKDDDLLVRLRTAIDWYASSFKTTSNRESFLFCAIGMEALLSNGTDSITKTLSENTAYLIAKKDIDSRKSIYKKMAYLYKHRSGIAHGGNANIEENDLQQIRYYLAYSIITIVRKIQRDEIYSVQDLMNYLENHKFG